MNSAFEINMEVLSNTRLRKELEMLSFEEASKDLNCFVSKCGDYSLAKKNFPYDDIENPAQSVIDTCKECIKTDPQKNDFIVIYGLGLGYILDEVYTRYSSRIYVYEPDINVIRFVMQNVDLTHILSDPRVFISNNCEECCKKIGEQYLSHDKLEIVFLKNYGLIKPQELIKLTNTLFNTCKAKISDINTLRSASKTWVKNIIANIECDKYIKPFYNLDDTITRGTALILSAGPSLIDNIENIKKNRHKFILFAIGKTLKTLEANGITPDFAVFADATTKQDEISALSPSFTSKINFVGDIKSDALVSNIKWKDKFFYFANNTEFINKVANKLGIQQYPAIATSTLNALLCASRMGFKEIALCGFDLAFKDSVAYCDGTTFTIENDNITINGEPNARRVLVKSVSGEMIPTREDFAMFIKQCENNLKLISEDVKLYNITDFGAYIRGLVYTTLDAIMPEIAAINVHYLIERTNFDKLSLKNALETELDIIDEIKEQFSEGAINYTKIYSLKKSALLSEYTRFEILELVENEFSTTQLEKFVDNVINSTEEVKGLILKNLVKI